MSLNNIAKMVNKANKEKTPAQEFLFMYERASVIDDEFDEYKGGVYRPSSIGGCKRMQFYMRNDYPRDSTGEKSPDLVDICDSGTDRHDRIQKRVMKMRSFGMDVDWIDVKEWIETRKPSGTYVKRREGNETRLGNDDFHLHFKCDGIIKFKGVYYILEIKTEISMKHRARTEPELKHKYQASTYALALGIDRIMYVYENRDMCNKKVYVYEVKPEMTQKVVDELNELEAYYEAKKIPPMVDDKNKCNYCDFKNRCKNDGKTEAM